MICEPEVEVICDECQESIFVSPKYKYRNMSGNSGFYALEDSDIEEIIQEERGWYCKDGEHLCDECWAYANMDD